MKKYKVNINFIEHELNGQKYLIKTEDSDIKYPKLYVLNDSSYDIFKYVEKNDGCTLEDIHEHLKEEYRDDADKIKISDIEECILNFTDTGIIVVI